MPAYPLKKSEQDRRRQGRYKARLKVRFRTPRAFAQEYTINISKGGIFVQTGLRLDREDPVEVVLCLPHTEREITLHGRVAWVLDQEQAKAAGRPAGLGLEIIDLKTEDREIFELYIERITEAGALDE